MRTSDLVFIGIKGAVMALNRAKGQQEWVTRLKGSDFVNIILQQEAVLASWHGEIFSLDPLTGEVLWHNSLKGLESGWPRIATEHNQRSGTEPLLAEKRRRDAQAAS